jgi:hypothetical protein
MASSRAALISPRLSYSSQQKGLSDEDIENIIFTEDRNKGIRDRSQEFWSSISRCLFL